MKSDLPRIRNRHQFCSAVVLVQSVLIHYPGLQPCPACEIRNSAARKSVDAPHKDEVTSRVSASVVSREPGTRRNRCTQSSYRAPPALPMGSDWLCFNSTKEGRAMPNRGDGQMSSQDRDGCTTGLPGD